MKFYNQESVPTIVNRSNEIISHLTIAKAIHKQNIDGKNGKEFWRMLQQTLLVVNVNANFRYIARQ